MPRKTNLVSRAENRISDLRKKERLLNVKLLEVRAEIKAFENMIQWSENTSRKEDEETDGNKQHSGNKT
jgi:hypothetical protein